MDIFDDEFYPALRRGDFKEAETALHRWKPSAPPYLIAWAKSLLLSKQGHDDAAHEALSDAIRTGQDVNNLCRFQRGENALNADQLPEALEDFSYIIADIYNKKRNIYLNDCLLRKAYIYAVEKNKNFESVFGQIPQDAESLIAGAIYTRTDLAALYRQTSPGDIA